MAVGPSYDAAAMQAFERANAQTLRWLWFLGDVHGEFSHIEPALKAVQLANTLPAWLVFLGDVDIEHKPFREYLQPLCARHPDLRVAFIHGNRDADTHEYWACLHDCGEVVALHACVVDLGGIRVTGIGGNFQERVWTPPAVLTFANKAAATARGPCGWRGGQRPNPKLQTAIYQQDVAMHKELSKRTGVAVYF